MFNGKNLKIIRNIRNCSQEKLARELFVSRQTIQKRESGQNIPSNEDIKKMARFLNAKETDFENEITFRSKSKILTKKNLSYLLIFLSSIGLSICLIFSLLNPLDIKNSVNFLNWYRPFQGFDYEIIIFDCFVLINLAFLIYGIICKFKSKK